MERDGRHKINRRAQRTGHASPPPNSSCPISSHSSTVASRGSVVCAVLCSMHVSAFLVFLDFLQTLAKIYCVWKCVDFTQKFSAPAAKLDLYLCFAHCVCLVKLSCVACFMPLRIPLLIPRLDLISQSDFRILAEFRTPWERSSCRFMTVFDVCLSLFADTALCQVFDSASVSGQMQHPLPLPSLWQTSPVSHLLGYKQMIALRRDKEA